MNRRNISRRLERLEGQESPVGTGGRMANVEYDDEVPDGTLIRLPRSDRGDQAPRLSQRINSSATLN
jgi:hypothetical protein